MKKIIPFLALFLFINEGTRAQSPITVDEDNFSFGSSSVNGFSVVIPEAEYESTMKNWVKLLESGTKSSVVSESDGMSIFGARIKAVSDNPVNVYSKLSGQDSVLNLQVAIELEKDHYAGNSELTGVREYLIDFAKGQYLDIVNEQIAVESKILNDLKKELKSLERSHSRMEKSIKSSEQDIITDDEKLAELNNELASVSSEISRYEVGGMGNQKMTGTNADLLKDLEKQEKKIRREINSLEKKLGKNEGEISQNEREIPRNVNEQEDARMRVEEQEAVLQKYIDKREAIEDYR